MIALFCLLLTQQAPTPTSGQPASGWIDAPEAPTSTVPLPPSTAPRDGEPSPPAGTAPDRKPAAEVLVVPPVPREPGRVAIDDGLLPALSERRFASVLERHQLVRQATLDLDSFLDRALIPGLVWLPQQAGRALPTSRGHLAGDIVVVVDDVPLIDGLGAASLTESIGLLAPARLTFRHGARADSPGGAALGGVLAIDTGGSLDDVGESLRIDGLLGAGYGGPDNEKGAFALARSGWRALRITAHGTLLHREDFRTGRAPLLGVGVDESSVILANTGGIGGTVGARVDVVPVDRSRLFVTWQAGRGLDVGDVQTCPDVDTDNRARDCTRTTERGTDVAIAGFDVARDAYGLSLQPQVRVHAQRFLDVSERSGSALIAVDRHRDEVVRGGLRLALQGRTGVVDVVDLPGGRLAPSFVVAVDLFGDRFSSTFASRSLLRRDAEPRGDGIEDPLQARFSNGATARQGHLSATLRADGDLVELWLIGRLGGQTVDAADVAADSGARLGGHVAQLLPGGEGGARLHLLDNVDVTATVGHVQRSGALRDIIALVRSGDVGNPGGADPVAVSDTFVESGVAVTSAAVDVDVVAWGSLRPSGGSRAVSVGGVEGRLLLKPGVDGLTAQAVVSGFAKNVDGRAAPDVLQPQAGVVVRYRPSSWPVGVFARVQGAVPQNRLAADELGNPALCPELPTEPGAAQTAPCSGADGFVTADLGASLQLGELRFDVVGENVTDTQGSWRGAPLGTGGTAVRARVAFVF